MSATLYLLVSESAKDLYTAGTSPRGDAGVDLRAEETITIAPGGSERVSFGILNASCVVDDQGEVGACCYPRSSISKRTLCMEYTIGAITAGPLTVRVQNYGANPETIARGEALFQIVERCLRPMTVVVRSPEVKAPKVEFFIAGDRKGLEVVGNKIIISASEDVLITPGRPSLEVKTGIKACCFVDGKPWAFYVYSAPGLNLHNITGIIDAGYRGEIILKVLSHANNSPVKFLPAGRDLAWIISPFGALTSVNFVGPDHPVFAPGATTRGEDGFGSTGAAGATLTAAPAAPTAAPVVPEVP